MKYIFYALYAAAALVNVVCCAANKQKPRRIAKALLMPLLIGAYLTTAPEISWFAAAGLFFGWLGDLFLIKPGSEKMFSLGLGSFAVGHILYVIAILRRFTLAPPIWSVIALPVVFGGFVLWLYITLRPKLGKALRAPALFYVLLLAGVASLAGCVYFSGNAGGMLLAVGTVFFLASDAVLAVQTFTVGDPAPKYDFTVMLTYIIAQTLIAAAFCAA